MKIGKGRLFDPGIGQFIFAVWMDEQAASGATGRSKDDEHNQHGGYEKTREARTDKLRKCDFLETTETNRR